MTLEQSSSGPSMTANYTHHYQSLLSPNRIAGPFHRDRAKRYSFDAVPKTTLLEIQIMHA